MMIDANDAMDIVNLLNRYGRAYDDQDLSALEHCYTQDARFILENADGTCRTHDGRPEILANARQTFARVTWPRRHIITTHVIETRNEHVHASCYLQLVDTVDGAPRVTLSGRYDDVVRKDEGLWLIARRVLRTDSTFSLPPTTQKE